MSQSVLALEVFASGFSFPNGPVVIPDDSVLIVEITAGRASRLTLSGEFEVVCQTGGGPNGAAIGPDGHCNVRNNGGFESHIDSNGIRHVMGRAPLGQGLARIPVFEAAWRRPDYLNTPA
jgi:gluconolactonase